MFRNVFIGVDGKPGGRDAIALARRLGEPGARFTLAHVYGGAMTPGRYASAAFDDADAHADSERLLAAEREAGLLVFGPDVSLTPRRRFRVAANRVRREAGCLVWIAPDG